MNNTGVSVEIAANSAPFLKAMEEVKATAKAAASDMQRAMAAAKVPVPDIAALLNVQKQQVFKNNQAILGDTKATVTKLKALLEQEAAAYQAAARQTMRPPDINRMALSGSRPSGAPGQWDHLQGTAFQGGKNPSGSNAGSAGSRNMYGFGIAYNVVQDAAQGGLPALANNVPQIIDLVAKSPALKRLGAVGVAAASGFFAYDQMKKAIATFTGTDTLKNAEQSGKQFRNDEREYRLSQNVDDSSLRGRKDAEDIQENLKLSQRADQIKKQGQQQDLEFAALQQQERIASITAQEDKVAVEKELAAFQIKTMRDLVELEEKRAKIQASKDFNAASEARNEYEQAKNEMESIVETNRRDGTELSDKEKVRMAYLQETMPALSSRSATTAANAQGSSDAASQAGDQKYQLPIRERLINQASEEKIAEIQKQRNRDREEGEVNFNKTYFQFHQMRMDAEREMAKKYKETQRQREQINNSREINKLSAGGHNRKADKLQRKEDETALATEYEKTHPGQGKRMAAEDMDIRDRAAHPGRIRGAGHKGSSRPEKASALDYFKPGDMKKASTSSLDEYEKRRNIPGVGHKLDHDLAANKAKEESANANSAPKGDSITHLLLQKVIGLLSGDSTVKAK